MTWNKPYPNIPEDMKDYWAALREHRFVLWHCRTCGAWYWPMACCRNHPNEPYMGNMELKEASGRGKVFTYNIHYRAFHPGFRDEIPYIFALIELEESPLFPSTIIGCGEEKIRIGLPVEVSFEDVEEGFTLPKFRPVQGDS